MGGAPRWGADRMLVEGHLLGSARAESCVLVAGGPCAPDAPSPWLDSGEGRQEGVREQGPAFTLLLGPVLRLMSFPTP